MIRRKVNRAQTGVCCHGLDYPKQPHIHAEDCPLRTDNSSCNFPDVLFRENKMERDQWDEMGQRLGMTPLAQVSSALDMYGRSQPRQGSFAQTLFIMANDVAKADAVVQAAKALVDGTGTLYAVIEALEQIES